MVSVRVILDDATAALDGPRRRDGLAEVRDAEEDQPDHNDQHGDAGDREVAHEEGQLGLPFGALVGMVATGDELVDLVTVRVRIRATARARARARVRVRARARARVRVSG